MTRQEATCCSNAVGEAAKRHEEDHVPKIVRGINSAVVPAKPRRKQAYAQQRQLAGLLKVQGRRLRDMRDADHIDIPRIPADLRLNTWRTPLPKKGVQPALKVA